MINRRQFLKASVAAGTLAATGLPTAQVLASAKQNDRGIYIVGPMLFQHQVNDAELIDKVFWSNLLPNPMGDGKDSYIMFGQPQGEGNDLIQWDIYRDDDINAENLNKSGALFLEDVASLSPKERMLYSR